MSPKLSTVFALSRALNHDPGEMMGLGPRPKIQAELAEYLSRYSESDQRHLLQTFSRLNRAQAPEDDPDQLWKEKMLRQHQREHPERDPAETPAYREPIDES